MQAQHIIGHFEGFLLYSRQYRGLKNSWTTRKQQQMLYYICFASNQKNNVKNFQNQQLISILCSAGNKKNLFEVGFLVVFWVVFLVGFLLPTLHKILIYY